MRLKGSFVLKNGYGKLPSEKRLLVAFPQGKLGMGFSNFRKDLFGFMGEPKRSQLDPATLMEEAYKRAVGVSSIHNIEGVRIAPEGFFYPRKLTDSPWGMPPQWHSLATRDYLPSFLKWAIPSGLAIMVTYPSKPSGASREILRTYVGMPYAGVPSGELLTLAIGGGEFRTFSQKRIHAVSAGVSPGKLTHMELLVSPVPRSGKARVTWRVMKSENDEFLANSPLGLNSKSNELSELQGEFVTVAVKDPTGAVISTVSLLLTGFNEDSERDQLTIRGAAGTTIMATPRAMTIRLARK